MFKRTLCQVNREQVQLKENAQGDLISAEHSNLGTVQFSADKSVSVPAVCVIFARAIPITAAVSLQICAVYCWLQPVCLLFTITKQETHLKCNIGHNVDSFERLNI